jgi:metal-dependent amidase/aminoacylase/carboxypeptidase family protein
MMIRVLLAAALMAVPGLARAADGVSGTWVSGAATAAKVYVFKMQGDGFIGTVCGPCDDPSTVFRIASGTIAAAGHVSFSIVGEGKASSSPVTLTRVVGEGTLTATVKTETAPTAPAGPRLNGRWVAAGRVAQQNFTLKLRDGNRVWGVICGPCAPDGVFMIEDGVLEGDAISFFIHHFGTPAANGPRRNFMKGTIAGNVMKFKWVREGRESEPGGEMTLIGPIR